MFKSIFHLIGDWIVSDCGYSRAAFHFCLNFTAKSARIVIISRGDITCFCDYKIGEYSKIDPLTCERHPQKTRDAIE